MNFKDNLKEYIDEINKYLKENNLVIDVPEKKLLESMEYSLMAGGKRLRPALMLATYNIYKQDFDIIMPFAAAMEMVHNFSLIHDDLPAIDNDDFRHNKPTNHKVFGESTAILAGDLLLNNAYIEISKYLLNKENIENKIKAYNEFSISVSKMISGEFVDIECEDKEISYEMLEYMHQNKTGALLKASSKIGAILAGANEHEIKNIELYADKIGFAFQIKDDILSEIGDEETLGKPVGNDKKMKKSSFVTIYGVEKSIQVLEKLIEEAIIVANNFGKNSDFFIEFANYIKNRNK